MSSSNRVMIVLATVFVIGIILISTGVFLYLISPSNRNGSATTTQTVPTTNPNRVAIVFAAGGLGDKGFNDGIYIGATTAHNFYNINFTYSEPATISEYEQVYRAYAAHVGYIEPYDLVIGVGFEQANALMTVAQEYPAQRFAIIDMYIDPVTYPNVASVLFTENEGSALVGAIAGMITTTNKIGFLGGMDIPLTRRYAAGFVYGANLTNPGIEHVEEYAGDWANIALGKSLTQGLYSGNADIVFAAAGSTGLGAFDAAKEDNVTSSHPLWVIGAESPQMYLGCEDPDNPAPPTVCLTSMLKRIDYAVYDLIHDLFIGTWQSGLKFYDLANGGHSYEINTNLFALPQNIIHTVEMIRTGIINGTYVVPADVYWT